jgi:fatty-acyl-CoA synthase
MPSRLHNTASWSARRAEIAGDRIALSDAERTLDYAAFDERCQRCAAFLHASGVARGDRVALLLGNRTAYLEILFGAARLGAIAVPINARLTAPEVARILADCRPALLFHEGDLEPVARGATGSLDTEPLLVSCPDGYEMGLARATPRPEIAAVVPDDPMLLMYTSGTTGVPKGALLPHRKALFNSLNAQLFFDLTQRDRVLVVLPLFHSFGLCILALPALYAGAAVHLERRFDPARTWQRVEELGVTYMGGVPTQLAALEAALREGPARDTSTLRFVFGAGAAVPVEQILAFEQHGVVLKQGFGQTETSILCCLDARDAVRKAGSVGRPVFHAELRVVDQATLDLAPEAWRDVAPGETGEIVVRGPITMLGYWERPEASAETLRGEWLRTGDLAQLDDEGFVTLSGRARDMYISGGENVYPAEVEAVYSEHPGIREVAVVGVPDPQWGEVGRAYLVASDSGVPLEPESLRAWGGERLARFKLPREFAVVDALPRTETGKVQKHQLLDDSR